MKRRRRSAFVWRGKKKALLTTFHPFGSPVETQFLFTYKWQSFCTLRSELVLRCKLFCMLFHVWDGWITSIYIVYEAHFYCDFIINDDLKIACLASHHRLEDALMTLWLGCCVFTPPPSQHRVDKFLWISRQVFRSLDGFHFSPYLFGFMRDFWGPFLIEINSMTLL